MLYEVNAFLQCWEPTWLFIFIFLEAIVGVPINCAMLYILIKEYNYDKDWNERKAARRKKIIKEEIKQESIGVSQ